MATVAPSACGRSSDPAYPTLHSISEKLFRRGVESPFVFSRRNKRWLDFARQDSLIYRDTPTGETR